MSLSIFRGCQVNLSQVYHRNQEFTSVKLAGPFIFEAVSGIELRVFREERVVQKADVDGTLDAVVCLPGLQVVEAPAEVGDEKFIFPKLQDEASGVKNVFH
jgi:hypothetical protein